MEYRITKCAQIDTYAKYARYEVTDDCGSTVAYIKLLIAGNTAVSGRPQTMTILNPYREEIGYIKNADTLYLDGKYVDSIRRYSNAPERKGSLFMYALKYAVKHPADDILMKEKQWKLSSDCMYRKDGSVACTFEHCPHKFLQKECLKFECDSDDFYEGLLFACYRRYDFFQVVI